MVPCAVSIWEERLPFCALDTEQVTLLGPAGTGPSSLELPHYGAWLGAHFAGGTNGTNGMVAVKARYEPQMLYISAEGAFAVHDGPPEEVFELSLSPSGTLLAFTHDAGVVSLWAPDGLKKGIETGEELSYVAFINEDTFLIDSNDKLIALKDNGETLWTYDNTGGHALSMVSTSPDGMTVAVGLEPGEVCYSIL